MVTLLIENGASLESLPAEFFSLSFLSFFLGERKFED